MDKKLTDLEKKTIMEALPQMMAGLRVGGNVTCDELSRAGSDQTSQQGKSSTGDRLRRLNARFHRQWLESCDNRPGMAFVVEPGGGNVGVAKPFLDLGDIGLVFEGVGGSGGPE